MRERAFLTTWGLVAAFGLTSIGRGTAPAPAQTPSVKASPDRTPEDCYYLRYFPVLFRGPSKPYWVEWDLCPKDSDPPENRVKVETTPSHEIYTFDPADEIEQLERIDLNSDGNEQLLWVNREAGSGGYINWCVLGWINNRLGCWKSPNVESATKPLLKKDEDFGFKGWVLKIQNRKLILGHGIYHSGEGNCCPSRGGAFVELTPHQASFEITRVWRTSKPEYEQWLWSR
jgi:hypothetical protein